MTGQASALAEPPDAERRQITVVFCDLVDSVRLASQLDPEDLRDVLQAYQTCCAQAIQRHGGYVANFLGDGIVAYFGHPLASEDAAEQAVRAARICLGAVASLVTAGGRLQARAGVATGLALMGDILGNGPSQQPAITGHVANLASRIQASAMPGVVSIADGTRRLIGNTFHCTDLGLQALRGIDLPQRLWAVGAEQQHETRFDAARGTRQTRLIGRRRELRLLEERWQAAVASCSGTVLVAGAAGIGKSTLLSAVRRIAEKSGGCVAVLQCSPRHTSSPLYPIITYLQRLIGWTETANRDERLTNLREFLAGCDLESACPLMDALLSAGGTATGPAQTPLVAEQQRQKTIELALQVIQRSAGDLPLLIAVEDAHWADPTTHDLLAALQTRQGHRSLCVATARPELDASWAVLPGVTRLTLSRLQARDAATLVRRIVGRRLPDTSIRAILSRSDGVPLFLEEMSRAAVDGESEASLAIPMTLQDGLAARLDRLGKAKMTAQVAAVLGRSFAADLLGQVLGCSASEVTADLLYLEAASLIRSCGRNSQREYAFNHALLHEAAYQSLLRGTRRRLHAKVAAVLEGACDDLVLSEPETLAHHWEQGCAYDKAARYWQRAGERAQARAANVEAQAHFNRGLAALSKAALLPGRDQLEFRLQLGLGQVCYVLCGPAHPDTVAAYMRAQALVGVIDNPDQQGLVLFGIFCSYHFASKLDLAESPARLMLAMSTREGRRGDLCHAHRMLGYVAFFRGELAVASQHFDEVRRNYRNDDHGAQAYRYGADCLVGANGFYGVIESLCQPYAAAVARLEANCAYAAALQHPASLGWAYAAGCYIHYFGDRPKAALALSGEGRAYCTAQNVTAWLPHCRVFQIWAKAKLHGPAGRVPEVREVMALAASGNRLGLSMFYLVAAEIMLLEGQADAAVQQVEIALDEIEETGQRIFEPMGWLLLARCRAATACHSEEVATAYETAAELSRRIGAAVIEARALRALAGMLPRGAQRSHALARLEVLQWGSNGLNALALREAGD